MTNPIPTTEQPAPVPNLLRPCWETFLELRENEVGVNILVHDECAARDMAGQAKYGTRLQPHNGRDALRDAYEEVMDACVYTEQFLQECQQPVLVKQIAEVQDVLYRAMVRIRRVMLVRDQQKEKEVVDVTKPT